MTNAEEYDFYNKKIKEMNDIMNLELDDNLDDYDEIMNELGIDINELDKEFEEYTPKLELGYTKLHEDAVEPKYNYESDSGFDLHSTEEIVVPPFGRVLVPTGISLDINDGFEVQVRSKSGLALNQGLMCLNSPGTVDCFSEDMKILTINGEKTIKELTLNDIVFSFNENTLEIEKNVITNIFNTEEQDLIIFETESGVLEVTPNSEIYTKRGLILAKDINENDEIIVFNLPV